MKKIALLFTILCAGALNGMETKRSFWDDLPQDIRYEIINKALEASDSLDGAIAALKNLSVVQGIQFDKLFSSQKDFTKVVHMLADKFNNTPYDIAIKFKTLAASTYIKNSMNLLTSAEHGYLDDVAQLINDGADVNFRIDAAYAHRTPLEKAITEGHVEIVKLLLNSGANPETGLARAKEMANLRPTDKEAIAIQQMIKDAMNK